MNKKERSEDMTEFTDVQRQIRDVTENFSKFLIEKNKRYGNSALGPMELFSKFLKEGESPSFNKLMVRLDDKVSRISNSSELRRNDVVDIIGYLMLLCIERGWDDFSELID